MKIQKIIALVIICFSFVLCDYAMANETKRVHPYTKKIYKAGMIKKISGHFPEIPRILASTALGLYHTNKALFVLISFHKKDMIPGAIHMTENLPLTIDYNKLPLKKGQLLIFYCP